MGSLYLGGPSIQEVDGKMMMGLSIYGVAVISGSLYSRFYDMRKSIISLQQHPLTTPIHSNHNNLLITTHIDSTN